MSGDIRVRLAIEQLGLVPYPDAHTKQLDSVARLHADSVAADTCLVLQHLPVFTLGRNGSPTHIVVSQEFLEQQGVDSIQVERGGEVTYHGPGQLICYPIINLRRRHLRVTEYVHILEDVMLAVLAAFGIAAGRDPRNHGVWCGDRKLGSVGIAIRHGISYHGLALNVDLDMTPFSWINPCGMDNVSMGSMEQELQEPVNFKEVESQMIVELKKVFGDKASPSQKRHCAKPKWLKQRLPKGAEYEKTRRMVQSAGLHTVCEEARCPNQFECFGKGAATFMLMGESCTRNCGFCAVAHTGVAPLDQEEPLEIARAVAELGLDYAVLTSVTRDDLADGGAAHFAKTIDTIRLHCPDTLIEVLIPDLQGDGQALELLCEHCPSVLNHNLETVPDLYAIVRPQAQYLRSLELLRRVKEFDATIVTKSGLMLGLGESREELLQTMKDIRATGCDILTLGQYLQPSLIHLAVQRYVPPEEFAEIRECALELGFAAVASGPHVRSSYRAGELYRAAILKEKQE